MSLIFVLFTLLISMPRFSSINANLNRPKIKLFLPQAYKIFERWELYPQTPVPPAAGGGFPPDLQSPEAEGFAY